jgi:alpha-1,3-rhamnosyl/mannosyltransferase
MIDRVCLDVSAAISTPAGIGRYAWSIADQLFRLSTPGRIVAYSHQGLSGTLPPMGDKVSFSASVASSVRAIARSLPVLAHGVRLMRVKVRRPRLENVALFHAFNFVPPGRLNIPWIPVIHDLSHIRYPAMHPRDRVLWLSAFHKDFCTAPLVQTVSRFSQREITALLGIPEDRIRIVKPAIDPERFNPIDDAGRDAAVLTQFQLHAEGFILAVGTIEPRKNLQTLLAAYSRLPNRVRERFPLVLAGGAGWGARPDICNHLESAGHVRFTGYISEAELITLYRAAKIFAYPSFYEGFGMPVLEALACGTPVLVSRGTACEEVAAGLARCIEASDVPAWTLALQEALDQDATESAAYARHIKSKRCWRTAANEVVKIYEELGISIH